MMTRRAIGFITGLGSPSITQRGGTGMKGMLQILAVVAALVLGLAAQGQADNLTLSISFNGGAPVTCLDNAACDTNPTVGFVTFTTGFGTVQVASSGAGAPQTSPFNIDLNYHLSAPAGAPAATYTIQVSENDLNGSPSWTANLSGTQDNSATTTFAAFADTANVLFANNTALCGFGSTAAASFSSTFACGSLSDASFSLTEKVTIVAHAGETNASGDDFLSATVVPEPGTLLLFGSALTGIGALRRRWGRRTSA